MLFHSPSEGYYIEIVFSQTLKFLIQRQNHTTLTFSRGYDIFARGLLFIQCTYCSAVSIHWGEGLRNGGWAYGRTSSMCGAALIKYHQISNWKPGNCKACGFMIPVSFLKLQEQAILFLFEYVPEGFGMIRNSSYHRYWWGFWTSISLEKKVFKIHLKITQISPVIATSAEHKTPKQFTESGTEGNIWQRKMCFGFLNFWLLFKKKTTIETTL